MGNTTGTLNGSLVAMRTLETLLVMFPALSQISTDFSNEIAKFNQTVASRVVVATVASDYDTTNGYVAADRSVVDVPVTINKHKHHTYGVNDQERSSTNRNLIDEWAATGAHALGKAMMDDLFAIVTAATFTQSVAVAAANFDRDDMVRLRTKLNKLSVPDVARFAVVNSDYAEGLGLDLTIVGNQQNASSTAITDGKLPRISNFDTSEYSSLPDNAEKLAGIAGVKDALVIATRLPDMPSDQSEIPGRIEVVREPKSGLALQVRSWYDMGKGKEFRTMTLMYGVAPGLSETGVSKRLVRITLP